MPRMNDAEYVRQQYADARNLQTRQRLHKRHSVNPCDLSSWLFDQYQLAPGSRILELGCGTGAFWETRAGKLPSNTSLFLSDLSDAMVREAWDRVRAFPNVLAGRIDIEDIPFPGGAFDVVIANYMLYHIPGLQGALSQVRRVLKPGGVFYCATNGTHGLSRYLHDALKAFDPAIEAFGDERYTFSMQNGEDILRPFFSDVRLIPYVDSLRVTDTRDLIDYMDSTIAMKEVPQEKRAGLYDYFEAIRLRDGAIEIPKQTGLFLSVK